MFCLLQPFFQRFVRCLSKIKLKYVCIGVAVIALFDIFGAFTHMFEVSYNDHFTYPYNGEIQPFVDALRHNKKPDVDPINDYNYSFIHGLKDKCADPDYATLRLVFLVKSAAQHFDRRNGIRQSWGFGKRFFDVPTITIFLLGVHLNDLELQAQINAESDEYNDILQANFIDSYYNNTIKTMLGFKWAVKHCRHAKFYMFVDDDMYVSVKNVLRFIRNPAYYPDYLKEPSRRAARKREIKDSDWANTTADPWPAINEEIKKHEINESSLISRISKRATAKEKIMMRRRPGWTFHNKTRFPIAKSSNEFFKTNETDLLKNKRKNFIRNHAYYPDNSEEPSQRIARKREIKNFNWAGIQKINENKNNQSSLISKISKRATAKEKIMMRRRPGWTSHKKTRFPIAKSSNEFFKTNETDLLKNKRKNFIRNHAYYPDNSKEPSQRIARKREIKNFNWAGIQKINENKNNQSSLISKISKRATAKEKIMMRRRPGWTFHKKTRFPIAKSSNEFLEKTETNLLKNKRKNFIRNSAYYPKYLKEPNQRTSRKSEIKNSNWTRIEEINKNKNNQSFLISKMSKRATAKEKIMMRRRPGWTSHKKTQFPIAKSSNGILEKTETYLSENKRTNLSHVTKSTENSSDSKKSLRRKKRQIFDIELPDDVRLFAGYVIVSSPHRHRTSKWYVSLNEYPYHLWPPYVTAGAYVLSKEGLLDMYYTSLYTQHFRFDDIFLGIVAKKADIEPFHCDEFHFYKKDYTKYNYKYVITSHGYDDPDELQQVWNEQKSLGNA